MLANLPLVSKISDWFIAGISEKFTTFVIKKCLSENGHSANKKDFEPIQL